MSGAFWWKMVAGRDLWRAGAVLSASRNCARSSITRQDPARLSSLFCVLSAKERRAAAPLGKGCRVLVSADTFLLHNDCFLCHHRECHAWLSQQFIISQSFLQFFSSQKKQILFYALECFKSPRK